MFVKTPDGIVINKDESYLKAIKATRETKSKIDQIEKDFSEFKSELSEIKSLLLKVING
jgi:hypothetical protein